MGERPGWQSACARWDVANDHLRVPPSILGVGLAYVQPKVPVRMCVYSYSQLTNYCPKEPTAVATTIFSSSTIALPPPPPPPASSLLSVDRGESEGSLSPRSCSLGESLHHCGTPSHTHMHKLSLLSLSICHYATMSFN